MGAGNTLGRAAQQYYTEMCEDEELKTKDFSAVYKYMGGPEEDAKQ